MMVKIIQSETLNSPRFERFVAVYKCGCSFYNDSWKSSSEMDSECQEHGLSIKAKTTELVIGTRPNKADTKKHTIKLFNL